MIKEAPSFGRIFAMVAFALSCFGILVFLWLNFGGSVPLQPQGYRVKVSIPEATQLSKEADVRISGVPVGRVKNLEPNEQTGLTDTEIEIDSRYAPIPKDTRARRIGALHGGGNVVLTGLFALSLLARWGNPAFLPNTLPLILGLLGAVLALFTAWLGGELVYRLRVAVDDDANLNATNSISREGIAEVRT